MYNAFFGFRKTPFASTPDPEFFFRSKHHEAALKDSLLAIENRMGLISLVGEEGTGKTVVLECLRNSLGSGIPCAFLSESRISFGRFLEIMASDLDLDLRSKTKSAPHVFLALTRLMTQQARSGSTVVLIVDDAHNLPADAFDEIVHIASLHHDKAKEIQTVFAGRPTLQPRLAALNPDSTKQRAILSRSLYPFTARETEEYIEFRLACAGMPKQTVFPRKALREIYDRSQGFAPAIHVLCENLLLNAFTATSKVCTPEIRDRVFKETHRNLSQIASTPPVLAHNLLPMEGQVSPGPVLPGAPALAGSIPELFSHVPLTPFRGAGHAPLPPSASGLVEMEPANLIPVGRPTASVLSASLDPSIGGPNTALPLALSARPIPAAAADTPSPSLLPPATWIPRVASPRMPWTSPADRFVGVRKPLASYGRPLLAFVVPIVAALALYSAPPAMRTAADASRQEWHRAQQAVLNRAAVAFDEDFRTGLSDWTNGGGSPPTWTSDASGFVRPGALALYRPSLSMIDYQMQFLGMIDKTGLSWVARAADFNNYYAIRLTVLKSGPLPSIGVTRYAVIHGIRQKRFTTPVLMSARADTVYRVRLEVKGNHFALSIQDQPVDSWSEPRLGRGSIGFFSEKDAASRIASLHVRGHYDMLGRLCAFLMPSSISNYR